MAYTGKIGASSRIASREIENEAKHCEVPTLFDAVPSKSEAVFETEPECECAALL
jgi:hypothetical protein